MVIIGSIYLCASKALISEPNINVDELDISGTIYSSMGVVPDKISYTIPVVFINDFMIPQTNITNFCLDYSSFIPQVMVEFVDMKEKLGVFDAPLEEQNQEKAVAESNKLRQDVAKHALSLVCDNNKIIPLNPEKYKNITIVYSGYGKGILESLDYMKDEFLKHGVQNVNIVENLCSKALATELSSKSDLMLYVSHLACHQPRGVAGYQEDAFITFYHTTIGKQKGKRIGVSLCSPYAYFDYYHDFDCFINAFNNSEETQRAFVKALYGEIPFNIFSLCAYQTCSVFGNRDFFLILFAVVQLVKSLIKNQCIRYQLLVCIVLLQQRSFLKALRQPV